MSPIILASGAMLAVSAAASPTPRPAGEMPAIHPGGPAAKACPPTSRYEAARRGGKLKPELLNQLPAADLYKAVYRRVGGCEVPIIARYGIGAR